MNGPNAPKEPVTTLFSGMVLERPLKEGDDKRESVRFLDLVWARPHTYRGRYGTLVLHAAGDFRFYSQPFGSIANQVAQFVGRLVKQGNATIDTAPKFPWVYDQSL
jgi:hypothetical protein